MEKLESCGLTFDCLNVPFTLVCVMSEPNNNAEQYDSAVLFLNKIIFAFRLVFQWHFLFIKLYCCYDSDDFTDVDTAQRVSLNVFTVNYKKQPQTNFTMRQ